MGKMHLDLEEKERLRREEEQRTQDRREREKQDKKKKEKGMKHSCEGGAITCDLWTIATPKNWDTYFLPSPHFESIHYSDCFIFL